MKKIGVKYFLHLITKIVLSMLIIDYLNYGAYFRDKTKNFSLYNIE